MSDDEVNLFSLQRNKSKFISANKLVAICTYKIMNAVQFCQLSIMDTDRFRETLWCRQTLLEN